MATRRTGAFGQPAPVGPTPSPQLALPVGAGDHVLGPADAPVTLVVYGDFECPYTRKARTIVRAALQRSGTPFRYVFRHFPLAKHPHAFRAAEASEAAAAQRRFWEMYDLLFDRQWALEDADLAAYAGRLGLDVARFEAELAEGTHAGRVQQDLDSGQRSGVTGTPTYFVNGQRHENLEDDIDRLLSVTDAAARWNAAASPRPEP